MQSYDVVKGAGTQEVQRLSAFIIKHFSIMLTRFGFFVYVFIFVLLLMCKKFLHCSYDEERECVSQYERQPLENLEKIEIGILTVFFTKIDNLRH